MIDENNTTHDYNDDSIVHLEWNEHIRQRPGMYIGNTGDGSLPDDGIYILIKEVMDNAVDEFASGFGKTIELTVEDTTVTIRDFGRGIPPKKLVDVASVPNTGGKFDTKDYKRSVGLNGVGLKAVNATSDYFHIETFRDGHGYWAEFSAGNLTDKGERDCPKEKNGTLVIFHADDTIFPSYRYNSDFITAMVKNYSYLHSGLTISYNGTDFISKNGLLDLITENMGSEPLYPPIHLIGEDIELVITHGDVKGEDIASFVNGQNTTRGGTHLAAFREGVAKTFKSFYNKEYDPADIRESMIGAVSVQVIEPIFGDQTKTKLNSKEVSKDGLSIRTFICDFIQEQLDNFLHKNPETAAIIQKRIQESERRRKAIGTIDKASREKLKKASICNRKLRDCHVHYTDSKSQLADSSSLFITEGDSASGSITKIRDVKTQAVFSLRGKVLNAIKKSDDIAKNEELIMLRAALNIDEDIENLRYNKVIIATDADNDGLHIRLLLMSFFLKLYPEMIRSGHLFILQTPLFRVRNKKETETIYCYNEEEKQKAIKVFGKEPQITRFKGLGEISPEEFKEFIGEKMRLDAVRISSDDKIDTILEFYMGENTEDRQTFIRENLRSDIDIF